MPSAAAEGGPRYQAGSGRGEGPCEIHQEVANGVNILVSLKCLKLCVRVERGDRLEGGYPPQLLSQTCAGVGIKTHVTSLGPCVCDDRIQALDRVSITQKSKGRSPLAPTAKCLQTPDLSCQHRSPHISLPNRDHYHIPMYEYESVSQIFLFLRHESLELVPTLVQDDTISRSLYLQRPCTYSQSHSQASVVRIGHVFWETFCSPQ